MKEIPLTKGYVALVDDEDYERVKHLRWIAQVTRWTVYARARLSKKQGGPREVRLHRYVVDAPDGIEVDHKDRNGLNNRRDNLRLATRQQNGANRTAYGTSRFLGVSYDLATWSKPWRARCGNRSLGRHSTEVGAALEHDFHAARAYGEFSNLNFPYML